MRRILLLLTVISLAFAVLIQGRAKAADDETQLIQLERSWNQAEMGRDAGAIASLFDDTLVYVDYDGSLKTRAEYLRSVANPGSTPEHMYDEGMKVHVYSNAGVVSGVYRDGQGKTVHAASAIHGHLDQAERPVEMRGQPKHARPVKNNFDN